MNCCSNKCISFVTLIISIVILLSTNFLTFVIFNLKNNIQEKNSSFTQVSSEQSTEKLDKEKEEWKLIIPKMGISANIIEGTDENAINNHIGHFTATEYLEGNIGLIAGNNGYKENYFKNLEMLEDNDVIIYKKGSDKKEYKVIQNIIINETDWSYLSSTEDNRITLITGVIGEPTKRRCVQAIEV